METKTCRSCGVDKPLEEFSPKKVKNQFKTTHQTHAVYCKQCNAERAAEWRKNNSGYSGSGKVASIPKEDRLLMSAIRQRLVDARSRCKKLGRLPPEVSAEYLYEIFKSQERKCALTGAPLNLEKEHPLCLSLDQIEPEKGYVVDNVQWVAWCVNRAKGDLPLQHFYEMCEAVLDYRKVQRLSKSSES